MRTLLVLAIVGGCSGGHATPDASVPDAGGDSACPDGDGDGICDAVDLCPATPDPAQVDLDHDHLGWMCDPVESTDQAFHAPGIYRFYAAAERDRFASLTTYGCNTTSCTDLVVAVDGSGAVIGRSDSGLPADIWLAGGTLTGPFISTDGQLLWSRGFTQGDLGRLDLATGSYTPEAAGPIYNSMFAGTRSSRRCWRCGPARRRSMSSRPRMVR